MGENALIANYAAVALSFFTAQLLLMVTSGLGLSASLLVACPGLAMALAQPFRSWHVYLTVGVLFAMGAGGVVASDMHERADFDPPIAALEGFLQGFLPAVVGAVLCLPVYHFLTKGSD